MRCPTCDDAKDDECCTRHRCFRSNEERELAPNPYAYEIGGNRDEHLQCSGCRYSAAMDI